MFRHNTDVVAEVGVIEQGGRGAATHDDLIPLSVLRLDLDPGEPWPLFLGRRGVAVRPDRIGRDAITAGDAQRLIAERRSDELRKRAVLKSQEEEAVEADRLRRAQIWKGVAADLMPDGVAPAAAMLQTARDAQPKRTTPLERRCRIRGR
jgi:hypothetical protein